MGCIEVCKKEADPFDLICRMQEKKKAIEEKGAYLPMLRQAQEVPGEIEKGKPGSKAISLCFIEESFPRGLESSLFDGLTRIKGGPYNCLTGWLRIGMPGQVEQKIRPFVENLAATGEKEIIFIHPGCYATATVLAKEYQIEVPFRSVHIFEYLLEQMTTRKGQITKLNMKIAYHRPCPSRMNPEMDPLLDELFELIGIKRVARKYDHFKTLCCGSPLRSRGMDQRMLELQEKNLEDAKQADAEALAFFCTGCLRCLGKGALEREMDVYMVSDLCRLAIGEELPSLNRIIFR